MVQLNLLPDVKQEYIHAERTRRLVLTASVIACAVSIGLLFLLFSFDKLQQKNINDLTKDISSNTSKLQKKPQINKILTVQNQLNSLTGLHASKPSASRLFGYLNQVTPTQVDITSLSVDFTTQTVTISGTTDAISSVNKYIDTLKFTTFKADGETPVKAFSNVVMSSFGVATATAGNSHTASYSATFIYDPAIFDNTKKIKLIVPSLTTTRSSVDQPNVLFQEAPTPSPDASVKTGGN